MRPSLSDAIDRALQAGFVKYLTKPVDVASLLATLDALLTPV